MNAAFIKEKALELGFDLAGFAPAGRFSEADFYPRWLEKGFAGEMDYLARNVEKRENCQILFPPAQSVIVCGMSYHTSATAILENAPATTGRISRYAWGDDYHAILKRKLFALLECIQKEISSPLKAKVCVDTVPILERLHGKYAGLGWIGKHGCLINQQYGSWFFLGEILINLDLEYDSPVPDRCGACTHCLEVCPTGAFVAPRILDARRCISYLTIELKSSIPEELRPFIGNNVFGCDRCQEVCPWNQKAEAPGHSEFLPREQLCQPDLAWILSLSPEMFNKTFKNNPVKRAKLRGLLRNTIIAIGNSGNPDFIPLLKNLYNASESLITPHIEWAVRRLTTIVRCAR